MERELEDNKPEHIWIFTFEGGQKYGVDTGEGLVIATMAACVNTGRKMREIVKVERTI